jgi:DNA sulfur modification protein DndD
MFIKKIELLNFRQFSEKKIIEFSTDAQKNVTVIMGDNGAGKTTLAQAFLWALYGQTEFKVKELINRDVRDAMRPNDEVKVSVDLYIVKDLKNYIVSRRQKFTREYKGIKAHNVEFVVGEKNENGEWEYKNEIGSMSFVKQLLPYELSKFFFFDGERIKKMSDEIENGKSKEFADAVRGLVGLTAMMNAISHFKPSTTNSTVIGRYSNAIDNSGDSKLFNYTNKIANLNQSADALKLRINDIEPQIEKYTEKAILKKHEYLSLTPAIELKQKYDKLEREIAALNRSKVDAVNSFLKMFSSNALSFFVAPLIKGSMTELKDSKKLDKGIPKLHADTVKFLLEREICICGNHLEAGSEGAKKLYDLIDVIPPKSLGQSIGEYSKNAKNNINSSKNYYQIFESEFKRIREIDANIESKSIARDEIYNNLSDTSKAQMLKNQQAESEAMAKKLKTELRQIQNKLSEIDKEIKYLQAEKDKMILMDEKNKKNRIFLEYARYIYNELSTLYSKKETEVRMKLQDYINDIFNTIYDNGIELSVDERYNIKVKVTDVLATGDELERNTAQNYAIIFAFISGIIKMAKEKSNETYGDENQLSEINYEDASGYPLVMDAPLSAFDKKRIHNICETIPNIAQQVIIFIKDTDGDVAEEHMGDKIGLKWLLKAITQTQTEIERRVD